MIKITLEPQSVPGLDRKSWGEVVARAMGLMGAYWHEFMRPKHFTHSGAALYGYSKRVGQGDGRRFSTSYTGRKLRKFGHTLPLVYTGRSRTLSSIRNITANSRGVTIRITAPTLNLRPKGGRINMRKEMETVASSEMMVLDAEVGKWVEQGLSRPRRDTGRLN